MNNGVNETNNLNNQNTTVQSGVQGVPVNNQPVLQPVIQPVIAPVSETTPVVDNANQEEITYAGYSIHYNDLPTTFTEYTLDISTVTGIHTIIFIGGYVDVTGYSNSSTSYANIRFIK